MEYDLHPHLARIKARAKSKSPLRWMRRGSPVRGQRVLVRSTGASLPEKQAPKRVDILRSLVDKPGDRRGRSLHKCKIE
jgi:hypothetical protein